MEYTTVKQYQWPAIVYLRGHELRLYKRYDYSKLQIGYNVKY
jgi:hypothetical protein